MNRCREDQIEIITLTHRYITKRDESIAAFIGRDVLYLCDACLRCFHSLESLTLHSASCPNVFWIPGQEIYRCSSKKICVYEIDGRKHVSVCYARRLSILTKLFLPDKVTLDDVHFFAFTALFELDDYGFHFAGYFSKEWQNSHGCFNTLSCIMVLPPFKGKGYGSFLAELSYELGRKELSVGTPERPLSWSGKHLFRKIWKEEVLRVLHSLERRKAPITLNLICKESGLIIEDALVGLQDVKVLFMVGRQGPVIVLDRASRKRRRLSQDFLQWESMVLNVTFPFGVDFTRLSLFRLFEASGVMPDEIFLDEGAGKAVVSVPDTFSVQGAMLRMEGCSLFGSALHLSEGQLPLSVLPYFTVTFQPTTTLLVNHISTFDVLLWVRHIKGVKNVVTVDLQRTVIFTSCTSSTIKVRAWIINNALSSLASLLYLKRT